MHDPQFSQLMQQISRSIEGVDGWLSQRETRFLALAASAPTCAGAILEIGSFRGRSTITLALASRLATAKTGQPSQLIAVDPMLDGDPLVAVPLPAGEARRVFEANLKRAGVRECVDFRETYSYQLAPAWRQPLRLLWIDGDHRYAAAKLDFDLYAPFLADGAILAMHDVLSRYDGCIRVFCDDVLASSHFAAAGLCGSIGWAQYRASTARTADALQRKERLRRRLVALRPYHERRDAPRGLAKLHYKWLRNRVPHRRLDAQSWRQQVQAA